MCIRDRYEIGQKAAEIVAARLTEAATAEGQILELEPNFNRGETVRKSKN